MIEIMMNRLPVELSNNAWALYRAIMVHKASRGENIGDSTKVSQQDIINNCTTHSKTTVRKYLKELLDSGYIKIERKKQGELVVNNYKELVKSYSNGEIHPLDLKEAAAKYVNDIIEPVRKHFRISFTLLCFAYSPMSCYGAIGEDVMV